MERRLATILAADVVGYSAKMEVAELETISRLTALTSFITGQVENGGGTVFSRAGDGFLAEFPSPVSAVQTGFEIQRKLNNSSIDETEDLSLRIGIHTADIVEEQGDLLGDGVNIAARVESIAKPGSVVLTQSVFDLVKRNAQLTYEDLGEQELKNISGPIRLYQVVGELGLHSWISGQPQKTASAKPSNVDPHSLAVLPFANFSNDLDQEFFADGFTDDLITELARFRDLFVVSRNASFSYKGQNVDPRDIGQTLNVAFCLEGSIRKIGENIRVTVQLVETESGKHVWADKYNFGYSELFDVQDDIASDIVSRVFGTVERIRKKSIEKKRPNNLEAYECLLRGLENHRLGGVTRNAEEEAISWFKLAIEKDPNYGRAYAWQACATATLSEWTGEDVWDHIHELGQKGIELDDNDADCHRIAGSLALYARDLDRAKYHFQRALELLPNYSFIVGRMGELHNFLGDGKTALKYQERAAKLDPLLPAYCRELEIAAHYILAQHEAASRLLSHLTKATRRALAYGIASLVHLSDEEILTRRLNELREIDPDFTIEGFLEYEFYTEENIPKRLRADLTQAGLPKR